MKKHKCKMNSNSDEVGKMKPEHDLSGSIVKPKIGDRLKLSIHQEVTSDSS